MNDQVLNRETKALREHFSFLFQNGFEIVSSEYSSEHFGNWVIHISSEHIRLMIAQDRGGIMLLIGPKSAVPSGYAGEGYIGLEIVLVYLTNDKSYYPTLLEGVNDLDPQLAGLAAITKTYWYSIVNLFEKDYSASKKEELTQLGEQLFEGYFHPVKLEYPKVLLDLVEVLKALAASDSVQKNLFPKHVPAAVELRTLFENCYVYAEPLKRSGLLSETSLLSAATIHSRFEEMNLNNSKDWETIRLIARETLASMGKDYRAPVINQDALKRRIQAYGSTSERMRLRFVNIALIVAVSISITIYVYKVAEVGRGSVLLVSASIILLAAGVILALMHGRAVLIARPINQVLTSTSGALVLSWFFHISWLYLVGIDWVRDAVYFLLLLTPFMVLLLATLATSVLSRELKIHLDAGRIGIVPKKRE